MGGYGSGSWLRAKSKTTVERCTVLSMTHLADKLEVGSEGTLLLKDPDGDKVPLPFEVVPSGEGVAMVLKYRWVLWETVVQVTFEKTATPFRGQRIWFLCPFQHEGNPCLKRVGKLYRPKWGRYFGCRHCHNLAYTSSQRAHFEERFLDRLITFKKYLDRSLD